ncbi:FAD-binding oxidoreductase [Rhizobium sp. KVB221]|uniref:FAD-binding oxidoreductase n=1 Tax=Rhizobium setariae TaxID=2801340 RepID=A0A937CRV1_9HYPH|nr:FAD-binding oxidoreductase [Rhizobium setariae]MBL0375307.1 FAD-binding oxidoreductase [Rhizobium setariae]
MGHTDNQKNLWTFSAPPAPATGPVSQNLNTTVAIVGGGFTGLSAALHLAQTGVDCVVLEAIQIGHGGSGRNVGLVNAGMWLPPDDVVAALGQETGNRLLDELGAGPGLVFDLIEKHGIDCEAVRNGTLHLAVGEAGVKDIAGRARQWQQRGAPVEALPASEAARLTGAQGFHGALLDRRAGTVQPLGYARGLAAAAMKAGAKIYTGSPVTSARQQNGTIVLTTAGGTITAEKLIVASNVYSSVVPGMNWSDHSQELAILNYFQFATNPLPANVISRILPEEHGTWDTGLVMTSFRRDKAGRLIFGSIGALDGVSTATHRAFARRSVKALFPFIGDFDLEYWWDGKIGMTTNSLPVFHQPAENIWSITGYNGRGIAPGTVFGRALAHVVQGERTAMALTTSPVTPDPMRGMKTLFYKSGALAKHFIDRRFG